MCRSPSWIERRLPTALPSFQLLSFLISLSLLHFLSLHREGGECHGASISSFVFVWLQAAYQRWDMFTSSLNLWCIFPLRHWHRALLGMEDRRLLPSVLLFTDSFVVLSFWAQGQRLSLLTQDTFSHGHTLFWFCKFQAKRGHALVYNIS